MVLAHGVDRGRLTHGNTIKARGAAVGAAGLLLHADRCCGAGSSWLLPAPSAAAAHGACQGAEKPIRCLLVPLPPAAPRPPSFLPLHQNGGLVQLRQRELS